MPFGAPVRVDRPGQRRRVDPPGRRGAHMADHPSAGFELGVGSLTCASAHLCLATNNDASPEPGGSGDLVFATANRAGGAAAWSSSFLDQGYDPLTAIACPSEQL